MPDSKSTQPIPIKNHQKISKRKSAGLRPGAFDRYWTVRGGFPLVILSATSDILLMYGPIGPIRWCFRALGATCP